MSDDQPTELRPLTKLKAEIKQVWLDKELAFRDGQVDCCIEDAIDSALPEIERLIGERVAEMRGACANHAEVLIGAAPEDKEFAMRVRNELLALLDEQADKWSAEHDRELTKRVLESAAKHFPHTDVSGRLVCDCGLAVDSAGKWYQHVCALGGSE